MRVLIAPDKFKGTLTAQGAAKAMAKGVRRVWPDAKIVLCPMSDGGEGFVDVLCNALRGRRLTRTVCGPLPGMRVEAEMGLLPDGTAVIEMASAAGVVLLGAHQRNPMHTTTFGVGELIRFAVGMDCRHIILGIGGSATIDAGIGALQALGCPITLVDGSVVTENDAALCGRDVGQISSIGRPGLADGLAIDIACDVRNALTGPDGAAPIYGPQKGASVAEIQDLDLALGKLASRLGADPNIPGTGAAGGLGFGLATTFDVTLTKGVELIGDAVLMKQLKQERFDLILTGEGRYDATSLEGKVVGFVQQVAHNMVKATTMIFCGSRDPAMAEVSTPVIALTDRVGLDAAMTEPARHLADAVAENLAQL